MKTKIFTFLICGIILLAVPLSKAQNILSDGDFSTTTTIIPFNTPTPPINVWCTWMNFFGTGADGSATVVDGVCNYQIFVPGSNTWDVQLAQWGFPLIPGHSYSLTFDVRADADRSFGVFIGEDGGSYTNLNANNYTQSASTVWQTLKIHFDAACVFALHKLSFELGIINTNMYFDNIILEDMGHYQKELYDGDFNLTTTIVPYFSDPPPPNVWCYQQNSSIIANAAIIDKVCYYQISYAGYSFAEVQLDQAQFYMVPNHFYQLSFDVKADGDRSFGVYLGEIGGNWTNLLGWDKYIQTATTEWKTITLDFITTSVFCNQKLSFELGGTNTSMYFDNVILQDKGLYIPTISIIGTSASGWDTDVDMQSTDGIHYTLSNYSLLSGGLKFRQNHDWALNWGNSTFPTGYGYQDGPNIPLISYGNFDITFNRLTGEYSFTCVSNCPASIGIIGTAVPPNYEWGPDVNMSTDDGKNYFLKAYTFTGGSAKFRQDDGWDINWGNSDFPSGIATLGGPEIQIPAGVYNLNFNIESGAYSFEAPEIGIIGDALTGWNDDIDMQTNDGITYTLLEQTFTDGSVKFRANNSWDVNWGGWSFPTGYAYLNGWNNIPVLAGTYSVTFNLLSGEYSFVATTCPIPAIQCPWDAYAYAEPGMCGVNVYYEPVVAAANCGGEGITIKQIEGLPSGSFFPMGNTLNTFELKNKDGNTATCSFYVFVYGYDPPVISGIPDQLTPLWPPNHKMVPVHLDYTVSNNCGGIFTSYLYVYSSEPDNGLGDGDLATDWEIIDDHNILLRAERSGTGTGRVYYIYIESYDYSYNYAFKMVTVAVPHDQMDLEISDGTFKIGNQVEGKSFKVNAWPNPSNQNFNLQVESVSNEIIDVFVTDVMGRQISRFQSTNLKTISFGDDFKPGIYFIKVLQGNHLETVKAVKK